jgi:myo-inositol-1(or 4)-monophosphatase
MRVSRRQHLKDCLIGTGFPYRDGSDLEAYVAMMRAMMSATTGIRRPGAAALDLAYVAAGYYDGFWEIGLNPWDVAAGSLLITEAGGLVGDLEGENQYLFGGEVIAANPRVFAQIVNLLAPYRAALASRTASAKK